MGDWEPSLKLMKKLYCEGEKLEVKLSRGQGEGRRDFKQLQIIQNDNVITTNGSGYLLYGEINRVRSIIHEMKIDLAKYEMGIFRMNHKYKDAIKLKRTMDWYGFVLYTSDPPAEIKIRNIDKFDDMLARI